jgi:hypothetical protein
MNSMRIFAAFLACGALQRRVFRAAVFCLLPWLAGLVHAVEIPAALSPWQGWVLDKHPEAKCTRVAADLAQRRCIWPGRLTLAVSEKGGNFSQSLMLEAAAWVYLPGDRENWPQAMTLNGRTISALSKDEQPALYLEAGDYMLRGNFEWSAMPQSLAIPANVALLDLNLAGKAVTNPNFDGSRLWLRPQNEAADAGTHNSVKVEVFRKIEDDLPRTVDTVLRLSVSGKARELKLGRFLLKESEPIRFESPLPARIEDDGSLRIQARAGTWEVRMRARLLGDTNEFSIERLSLGDKSPEGQGDDWPTQEVWSFAANQSLRRAQVDGAPSVDPSQLDLPADFANLPTYLLDADTKLTLQQVYRGDATPAPNELSLQRTVWLDFEGAGATLKDIVTGKLAQGWRLETQPAVQLGRVRVNGEPQLVTQLPAAPNAARGTSGVEIREPQVNLEAVSRVADIDALNATGWQTDFNGVQMQVQLPPGWKLWHASGPDRVDDSWVSRWNLWAIFLSLLIVAAVLRLLDWRWAVVAAVTVALVYHENLAVIILMLPLLVLIALLKVIDAAVARLWILRVGYGFGALLVLVILGFAVDQIRRGIYPQLELPYSIASSANGFNSLSEAVPAQVMESDMADTNSGDAERRLYKSAPPPPAAPAPRKRYESANNVQTGPGEPQWSWQPITLSWSGPVKADQPLHLYLTGTWLTRLLKFFNVILVAALAAGILRALIHPRVGSAGNTGMNGGSALALVAGMLAIALAATPVSLRADDFPPKTLLDELQKRLLREPACAPNCAATEGALLQVGDGQLTVKLRVVVGADLAIALPSANNWQPRTLLVDGLQVNTAARSADGAALLPLARGNHDVVLEGPLGSDDITVQFADRPHVVRVVADDWDVFGINGNLLAANSVQLQKRQRTAQQDTLLPAPAKPFVRVVRRFDLDLDWNVTTTIERVAPEQGAIYLTLPLLPGESIVSGDIEAKDGAVTLSLGSQDRSLSWRSTLKPAAKLVLNAAPGQQWIEDWQVLASPRWHVTGEGLTAVKNEGGSALRQWRPWPGETLTLIAQQPLAVKGPTTTVESAKLTLTPGKRSSALETQLTIGSSIGGDYRLTLREPNELKSVTVNGVDVSQSRADTKLVLPLMPGNNNVVIQWELARGVEFATRTPALELDSIGNNISLALQFPGDRWPLWVSGPRIGPAMLYWGVLVVIVAVAFALAAFTRRFQLSIPLKTWHWLLLFIGMSTVNTVGSLAVLLWFFALEARRRFVQNNAALRESDMFYLIQIGIVLLSLVATVAVVAVIPQSLLSTPDMQVTGNGSSNYFFAWYQDRSDNLLPQAQVISVPLWCYRVAMLAWSLWLVFALLQWVKWGWAIFAEGGIWPDRPKPANPTVAAPAPIIAPPPSQP